MDEIIDHRKEKHAVTKENGFMEIKDKEIPKKDYTRMKVMYQMERCLDELGMAIGPEGGTSSRVCRIYIEQRLDG